MIEFEVKQLERNHQMTMNRRLNNFERLHAYKMRERGIQSQTMRAADDHLTTAHKLFVLLI